MISSLILSTCVLLAASISTKSNVFHSFISLQASQLLQGFSHSHVQFMAFAKILAVDVLPVHLGQKNIYDEESLFCSLSAFKISFTCSCHTTELKSFGLYFRYKLM
jgi:hypothetical protein